MPYGRDLRFVDLPLREKFVHHGKGWDSCPAAQRGAVDIGHGAGKAGAILQRVKTRRLPKTLQIGVQEAAVKNVSRAGRIDNGIARLERGQGKGAVCVRPGAAALAQGDDHDARPPARKLRQFSS